MRRLVLGGLVAACLCILTISTGPAAARSNACIDSWASDGHTGPWYTGSNQTLHGNSVHISCPSSSTAWAVDYFVFKHVIGGSIFFPINIQDKTGHGSTTFSASVTPIGCNPGWLYATQVHNRVTGGNISKPNTTGQVIC